MTPFLLLLLMHSPARMETITVRGYGGTWPACAHRRGSLMKVRLNLTVLESKAAWCRHMNGPASKILKQRKRKRR